MSALKKVTNASLYKLKMAKKEARIAADKARKESLREKGELLVGKVVLSSNIGLEKVPCVQVSCPWNEFDEHLKMLFPTRTKYWALDPESLSGIGDTVLIRMNEKSEKHQITEYVVERLVFQHGNVIDPVTKKRTFRDRFEEEALLERDLVRDIFEEPFRKHDLAFEERRQMQSKRLADYKSQSSENS